MANKQSFTPEEWTKILESTMLAGMAVSAAEPSGLWGLMKEGFASSSALAAAKADSGSSELVKAVIAEYEIARSVLGTEPADLRAPEGARGPAPAPAVNVTLPPTLPVTLVGWDVIVGATPRIVSVNVCGVDVPAEFVAVTV